MRSFGGWNNDASANTATGTFTMNNGSVTANSVTLGRLSAVGGSAVGTLTLNGGTFTLGSGGITDGGGTSTINLTGGSLNLNNHAIGDATNPINTFNLSAGSLSNVSEINGGGAISKSGAGTLTFAGTIGYSGATNVNAGTLLLNTSKLVSLAISAGQLDLKDNKLIVTGAAVGSTWNGAAYESVAGLVQSGYNGGLNDGSGIITSSASGSLTTLAVAKAGDVKGIADGDTALFAGQTVHGSDTLVMYTYGGDANLDGKLNVDDYGRIDSNIGLGTAGWFNGDFNYDGKVNVDDYGIIDSNIGIQGPPIPT